jgi:hypothetical protein
VNPAPIGGIHSRLGGRFAKEIVAPSVTLTQTRTESGSIQAYRPKFLEARAAIGLRRSGTPGQGIAFHDPSASKEKQ